MFYVSKIDYDNHTYDITDTDDNVTEFYTKEQIRDILPVIGVTSIRGVVYTGSDLKLE